MEFTLFTADSIGNNKNSIYPYEKKVTTADELKNAIRYDHVCATYEGNKRSTDRFISSDVVVMDCDNDDTDDSSKWVTFEKMDVLFHDVSYAIAPSRNNMKEKDGKVARPKFHIYFPISKENDPSKYANLKKWIHSKFQFFDGNCVDAARFIFGSDNGEIVWHEGQTTIDFFLNSVTVDTKNVINQNVIRQGNRNTTLSRYGARIIKRFGNTDKSKELFLKEANRCEPPLDRVELNSIWASCMKLYEKVKKDNSYVSPDEYNDDFSNLTLKPDDYTDVGQAKMLVREYKNELCYTDSTDFLRFNGEYWVESKQQAVGAVIEFLDVQLQDAKDMVDAALDKMTNMGFSKEEVKNGGKKFSNSLEGDAIKRFEEYKIASEYRNFVLQRRDAKYIFSTMNIAKPMLEIKVGDLDKDGFLLNTPTKTFDLREGLESGRLPKSTDYITKQTLVEPGEKGKELWLDALNLIFQNDKELIDYVQKVVGLCAIGKVLLEAMIIAYGGGRNGKSTFWNTISRVLGTYSCLISADALTAGCKRNVKPELAELKGRRVAIASELEEGMRLNDSIVKQITSTDDIQAEKKFKDPFKFTPSHTVILYTNHLPKVSANDEGIWRRLIVIPFNAKIEGKSDIKNYCDYLTQNAAPYVMKWIIEGAKKAIDEDGAFKLPKCVEEATAIYREDNDWLSTYLDENCVLDENVEQKSGELYKNYREYALSRKEYVRSTTDFYNAIMVLGLKRVKKRDGRYVVGVRLKTDSELGSGDFSSEIDEELPFS